MFEWNPRVGVASIILVAALLVLVLAGLNPSIVQEAIPWGSEPTGPSAGPPESGEHRDKQGTGESGDSMSAWTVAQVWGGGPSGLPVVPISASNGTLEVQLEVENPAPAAPPNATVNARPWIQACGRDPLPSPEEAGRAGAPTLRYVNLSNVSTATAPEYRSQYPAAGREGHRIQAANLSNPGDHLYASIVPNASTSDPGDPLVVIVLRLGSSNVSRMHEPFVADGSILAFVARAPGLCTGVLGVGPDWPFVPQKVRDRPGLGAVPYPVTSVHSWGIWDPRHVSADLVPADGAT